MKLTATLGMLTLCLLAPSVYAQAAPPQAPAPQPAPPASRGDSASKSRENRDGNFWSLTLFYWRSQADPGMRGGLQSFLPDKQNFLYPGKAKETPGVVLTTPAGRYNRLEFSVFETRGSGSTLTTKDLNLFAGELSTGTTLGVQYKIRNAKVVWNYLTYPAPPDAKLRVRTYYGFQYTRVQQVFDAPLLSTPAQLKGAKTIFYPVLGIGAEFVPSKRFLLEAKTSAFTFPHRSVYWDAEGSAIVRAGHLEIFGGGKAYHFKTAPKQFEYIVGTIWGPFGGVRWIF